jgi:hypothetical protein
MGFFSWKCAVSGESVANMYAGQPKYRSECYLITPGKTYHEPSYKGYGVFEGADVYGLLGEGDRDKGIDDYFGGMARFDVKVVLAKYYKGQSYDELSASEDCDRQGFFYFNEEESE